MNAADASVPLPAWRASLGRRADAVGLALLAYLVWQLFFARGPSFNGIGFVIGLTGIIAGWASRRRPLIQIDALAALYCVLAVLSTVVHHYRFWPTTAGNAPTAPWSPAIHAVVLLLYFVSARNLLTTPRRIGALLTVIVVAGSILGVQVLNDRAAHGLTSRILEYPSVRQWTGFTDLGLILTTLLPLPLAAAVAARSRWLLVASAFLTLAFLLEVISIFSRATLPTLAVTFAVLAVIERIKLKRARLIGAAVVGVVLIGAAIPDPAQSVQSILSGTGIYNTGTDAPYYSRIAIWLRAAELVRDHPWLGVGPGNYTITMETNYARLGTYLEDSTGYARPGIYLEGATAHAHNMLIHVAAESGIPTAIAFLLIWVAVLKGLLEVVGRDRVGMLALAVFGALFAFFFRCLGDHFMSGFLTSNRIGFLLWTLFAAGVALTRLRSSHTAPTA